MHSFSSSRWFSLLAAITIAVAFFTSIATASPTPTPSRKGPATPVSGLDIARRQSADDATDPAKVLAWLKANADLEPDRAVFYSGKTAGQPMAKKFCDENEEDGYKYFYYIFDQTFSDAFGGADPSSDTEIAAACSIAMAQFVTGEVRVFNAAGASGTSFWRTLEFPGLIANAGVTHIWAMDDDTTNPTGHEDDLKQSANEAISYQPGSCVVHVTQYQKNEGPAAADDGAGTSDYRFDITIKDDGYTQIGQLLLADGPSDGRTISVDSRLPQPLLLSAGNVDDDPVKFFYGDQSWSSDTQCSVGGYDSGNRDMDCWFDCPAPAIESDIKRRKL